MSVLVARPFALSLPARLPSATASLSPRCEPSVRLGNTSSERLSQRSVKRHQEMTPWRHQELTPCGNGFVLGSRCLDAVRSPARRFSLSR
jgi:hypothetical protein